MKQPNTYLILIKADYCDGQAIVTHPDGEMGGKHYLELHRTYPISIGTYRGESDAEAISEAAQVFGCSTEILYAEELKV